jgi:hypothetical protein
MAKTSATILALLAVLATSSAPFARAAGPAATGPIGGGRPNPALLGALMNLPVDPSGVGNASKIAPLPQPHITVPAIPQFK